MSLRDHLFSAGIINKKELRKSKNQAKQNRKHKQGQRRKKKVVEAEKQAQQQLSRKQKREALKNARLQRERAKIEAMKKRQVSQLLNHHKLDFYRAEHPFWHPAADGKHVHKMWVPSRLALELRAGQLAIAVSGSIDAFNPQYVLIPRVVAKRVLGIEPSRILFFNEVPPCNDDPAMRIWGVD